MAAKLTEKQKRFCEEYLIDLNATRAYKVVYKDCKKDETAAAAAARLLKNVKAADYISKRMEERGKRTEITQDWVLCELRKIAAANGSDFVKVVKKKDESGCCNVVEVTPTDDLAEEKRAAIASIKSTKYGISVETYDKIRALELLGRHLGLFTEKLEINGDKVVQIVDDIPRSEGG